MFKKSSHLVRIAIQYGILTFSGLTLFFFIMKIAGLAHHVELRSLNFIILATGVALSYRAYKKLDIGPLTYFEGLGLGFRTVVFSVIPFAVLMLIYLLIDIDFMLYIQQTAMFGDYLNPFVMSFILVLEGTISGFVITFAIMQYVKKPMTMND